MKKAKLIIGGAFLLGIGFLGTGGSNSNETSVKAEKATVSQKVETEKKEEVKDTTPPVITVENGQLVRGSTYTASSYYTVSYTHLTLPTKAEV